MRRHRDISNFPSEPFFIRVHYGMNGSLSKKALAGDASALFVSRVLHETRGLVTRIARRVTSGPAALH